MAITISDTYYSIDWSEAFESRQQELGYRERVDRKRTIRRDLKDRGMPMDKPFTTEAEADQYMRELTKLHPDAFRVAEMCNICL